MSTDQDTSLLQSIDLSLREIAGSVGELVEMVRAKREPTMPPSSGAQPGPAPAGWRGHRIHFGKQNDVQLGALSEKSLGWWIENYHPAPFIGRDGNERAPGQKDVALRAALNAAQAELYPGSAPSTPPPRPATVPPADTPPPAKPTVPPTDNLDEDVPF